MKNYQIEEVARILNKWNPLGDDAKKISDLDSYRTEASDIIFHLEISKANVRDIVKQVLNQAFNLSLTEEECSDPANEIMGLLKQNSNLPVFTKKSSHKQTKRKARGFGS
jgi:hypothetical protein